MWTTTNIWSWRNWTIIIARRYTNRNGKISKSKINLNFLIFFVVNKSQKLVPVSVKIHIKYVFYDIFVKLLLMFANVWIQNLTHHQTIQHKTLQNKFLWPNTSLIIFWGQMVPKFKFGRIWFKWRKPSTSILRRCCVNFRAGKITRAPCLGQNRDFNANYYVVFPPQPTLDRAKACFHRRIRTR